MDAMPGLIQETHTVLHLGFDVSRPVALALTFTVFAAIYPDAIGQTPGEGNISSSQDCTEISINYTLDGTLTREEAIARMDEAFYESLNRFDACQMSLSTTSNSTSAVSGNGGGSGAAGEVAAGEGSAADLAASAGTAGSTDSIPSPNMTGTETTVQDSGMSTAATTQGSITGKVKDQSNKIGKTGELPVGSGKIPEDIPSADNDSVLEAQIRRAAMNETDPETRKKLWREYRKYKGLPQPTEPVTVSDKE